MKDTTLINSTADGSVPLDTGGSAFPQSDSVVWPTRQTKFGEAGMTLLDWFAGQALAGFLSVHDNQRYQNHEVAAISYNVATAMIAERRRLTEGAP